jgi:hypothetical protein
MIGVISPKAASVIRAPTNKPSSKIALSLIFFLPRDCTISSGENTISA